MKPVAGLFNLVQGENQNDTSTSLIAIKADVEGLSARGSNFRKRYYGALEYADGSHGKLPYDEPASLAEDAALWLAEKRSWHCRPMAASTRGWQCLSSKVGASTISNGP